ncbi:hypothetical protein HH311_17905 [Actinomycetospora sp. TBRC 11914]|nr:hypothetical protein [Actinomycetospora sp. TBRC 11914]
MEPYLKGIITDPELGPKFAKANTSFKVNYTEPEANFLLDCTVDPPVLHVGEEATSRAADVDLTMSADDGHKFWLGKLNLPVALARKKVVVAGPVTKLMGLLPALSPAFAKYRQHLSDTGREDLLP